MPVDLLEVSIFTLITGLTHGRGDAAVVMFTCLHLSLVPDYISKVPSPYV